MRHGRGAASTLARGWLRDGRRWSLGSSLVLAGTLIAMVGTAGILDGTRDVTLDRVSDFYTGDLRITPVSQGAMPAGWFALNASAAGPGAAKELQASGLTVSTRVEAQFVMSRQGLIASAIDQFLQNGQIPVETPGSGGTDANKALVVGGLVGIEAGDHASTRIAEHLIDGRLPRPTTDGTVEVAMSVRRLEGLLTPDERARLPSPPPLSALCHRDAVTKSTPCDITAGKTRTGSYYEPFVDRPVDIVGLFETGIDVLDMTTLVAAAPQVRELLGRGADEPIANALLVQSGSPAAAQAIADKHHWATEGTEHFAGSYVGQLLAVLSAVVFLVGALLFFLPTFLVSHGISRQLAMQQRELAVCTAIGVPTSTLRKALAFQVLLIAAVGAGVALVVSLAAAAILPGVLAQVKGTPLPAGFTITWTTAVLAVLVTVVAMAVGWGLGLRARSRLPLTAQLRSA
ncbi:MAG: FtsX-like permease family protein [bacterium]